MSFCMVAARWHFLNPKPQALNTPPPKQAGISSFHVLEKPKQLPMLVPSSLVPDDDCAVLQPKTYSLFCLRDPNLNYTK